MTEKTVFCGFRLSQMEVHQLDVLGERLNLNRTAVVRHLIIQSGQEEKERFEELKSLMGNLSKYVQEGYQLERYIASLLTALVRKSAKTDSSEAEKMILRARDEAGREGKQKTKGEKI